jgi:hypothetical protein
VHPEHVEGRDQLMLKYQRLQSLAAGLAKPAGA